jgi:DNA-binding MarR family transcriptional regulator
VSANLEGGQRARCLEIAQTCAGFNLRRASRAISQHFDRALAPVGLRMTQFTLLAALAIGDAPTVGELADGLVIDRTTMSRNLRLIHKAGLIAPVRTGDRRQQRYRLTAEGRARLEAALPLWRDAQEDAIGPLGADRWRGMLGDLGALLAVLRARPSEGDAEDAAAVPERAGAARAR